MPAEHFTPPTLFELIEETELRMLALLARRGFIVVGKMGFYVTKAGKRSRPLVSDDRPAYYANLAIGDCILFRSTWAGGNFERAARHAFKAGEHRALALERRRHDLKKGRANRKENYANRDAKIMDMVRVKLIAKRGRATVKELHTWLQADSAFAALEITSTALQRIFSANAGAKMRKRIRSDALLPR